MTNVLKFVITTLVIVAGTVPAGIQAQRGGVAPPPPTATVAAVVGCVAAEGQNWMLTNASEPLLVPATDGKTLSGSGVTIERAKQEPAGKQKYRLMNMLTDFGVPEHKGKRVLVRGLVIGSGANRRINLVSLDPVAPACP
jgi:hypothetical protein